MAHFSIKGILILWKEIQYSNCSSGGSSIRVVVVVVVVAIVTGVLEVWQFRSVCLNHVLQA